MELRSRPAPIRYDETASPPRGTDLSSSRAAALAMQALHERITVLESENAQLREAAFKAKTTASPDARQKDDCETLRTRVRLLQETLQKTQETMRGQASVITRSKEELLTWQSKATKLEEQLEASEKSHESQLDKVQSQTKATQLKLESAMQRVSWLEEELKTIRTVPTPSSPETVATRSRGRPSTPKALDDSEEKLKRLERDLEDSKHRESSLKSHTRELTSSLQHSEEARKLLLQHQIKSKAMMEEIVHVNERLVQTIHKLRPNDSKKGRKHNTESTEDKANTPSFQELM